MLHATWSALARASLGLISPPRCASCDAALERDVMFCSPCARTVMTAPAVSTLGVSATAYGGAIAEAIVRFKFRGRSDLARPLAHLLFRTAIAAPFVPAIDLVVPVPLHRDRLHERGYNQAALLAGRVARFVGRPFAPLALKKIRRTLPQATLDAEERAANVAGSFVVTRADVVRDRAVLLVDDVRTTGATLESCRQALLAQGARMVRFLTVAQA